MENGGGSNKKTGIEKTYQKKTQLEHILLRPDTYIGSVAHTKELMWVMDSENKKMIQKEINFVPGLYKIYDEILVNAADNKQRDKHMNCIKIDIDAEQNIISVWNNGKGIPVVMHKEEKMYVPTMIFGHLLTSSNYNDEEEKVTGGRNGYGAKLCNIFSESFTLETACHEYKKSFQQTWGSNMTKSSDPKITDFRGTDYTKVTFSPDLKKFNMDRLDEDIVALLKRRAYDVAASTRGVSVFLNGEKLGIKNFRDYIDLYLREDDTTGQPPKIVYEVVSDRWEVAITPSDRGFQQVSFVNSIATTKGGRHVDNVVDSIVKQLIDVLKKKNKGGINIKPFQVRNHMWVFINCLIVNPTFDSQTKENMTLQAKSFGSKCVLSEKFITNATKSGIVEMVLAWAKFKAQNDLAKTSGKKNSKIKGIPKLEDANEAGSKNSHLCTLILTEGDSAKTLAVSGLGVIGRDHYGVFPLRGKLLNVREATHKQILENAEINNLIKIIGLQYKKKYLTLDDLKSLRYGKVMIMTDQDQDGSHIKGLLINFIHTNWPELLRLPFLEEFITPIVKATKKNETISFYSMPEFEEWQLDTPNSQTYHIKYYKGLGTSTSKEAKEYFQDMAKHRIIFNHESQADDDAIVMAFAKKCIEQRKDWLTNHMVECKRRKLLGLPERYLYTKGTQSISYTEFINLELILFSNADNVRSIPCVVDGLKPGQRKVMFACFKRNDKREIKVQQLVGSIMEMAAYHHGDMSLSGTIVNLAQNFVGSNNINLMEPRGQFGTRLSGGKDAASPRYIFTIMSPLTRLIFHPHDDPLLNYEIDDNQKVEPTWYIPIIPMCVVNGAEGIGTGWSTKIPNYNPRDLIVQMRRMIAGDKPKMIHPWYKNFRGTIEYVSENRYLSTGNISILSDNKIEITELPVGTWTQNYKENVLEPLLHGSEKVKAIISDYKEYHTDTTVRFVVTFAPGEFRNVENEDGGFHRVFKLTSSINTGQMHAFDHVNCLKRFDTIIDILNEFYPLRLEYYVKRKEYLEGQLLAQADRLSDQARFILEKCDHTLTVENKKRNAMIEELIKRGYRPDPVKEWQRRIKMEEEEETGDEEEEEAQEDEAASSKKIKKEPGASAEAKFNKLSAVKKFDYLLGMSMWMLTEERKNELLKQRDAKLSELKALRAKQPQHIWLDDLDNFETKLNEVEEKERLDELGVPKKQTKQMAAKGKVLPKRKSVTGGGDGTMPTKNAIKVEFKITQDIIAKVEKAAANAVKAKLPKEVKVKKEKITENNVEKVEEFDEFDALIAGYTKQVKTEPTTTEASSTAEEISAHVSEDISSTSLSDKMSAPVSEQSSVSVVKKGPKAKAASKPEKAPRKPRAKKNDDGLKQSKLTFNTKRGKNKASDDESSEEEIIPRSKPGRRAASKKINYSAPNDSDENDECNISISDEDDLPVKSIQRKTVRAETYTIQDNNDDSDDDVQIKKPAPKQNKRNRIKNTSDSDESLEQTKKKRIMDDDDDSDFQL